MVKNGTSVLLIPLLLSGFVYIIQYFFLKGLLSSDTVYLPDSNIDYVIASEEI